MEFSILIPVYNTHIKDLCEALAQQASTLSENYEILFIDDCSELSISYLNQKVKDNPKVEYEVLTENIGRAAIRNLLFEKAKYDQCIIMDGDVSILGDDFIEKYVSAMKDKQILVGGHVYQKNKPVDPSKWLHWTYGREIESRALSIRQKKPYQSFMTSNFACTKATFQGIKFDESLEGYGHEDSLFGIEAERLKIAINHMDNPVQHDGLDSAEQFLAKQKNAVANLKKLYQNSTYRKELKAHSKLIRMASAPLPFFFLKAFQGKITKNLLGTKPKASYLQLQKLLWWHYG